MYELSLAAQLIRELVGRVQTCAHFAEDVRDERVAHPFLVESL